MSAPSLHTPRACLRAFDQLVWATLAAVHLAPLWKTGLTLFTQGLTWGHLAAWAAVLLSFAFFAVKACGVSIPGLRFQRATAPVIVLCFALAHGDTTVDLVKAHPETAVIALSVEPAFVLAVRVRKRLPEFLLNLKDAVAREPLLLACLGYQPVHDPVLARSLAGTGRAVPRGPPLAAR